MYMGFHIGFIARWDNRAVIVRGERGGPASACKGRRRLHFLALSCRGGALSCAQKGTPPSATVPQIPPSVDWRATAVFYLRGNFTIDAIALSSTSAPHTHRMPSARLPCRAVPRALPPRSPLCLALRACSRASRSDRAAAGGPQDTHGLHPQAAAPRQVRLKGRCSAARSRLRLAPCVHVEMQGSSLCCSCPVCVCCSFVPSASRVCCAG